MATRRALRNIRLLPRCTAYRTISGERCERLTNADDEADEASHCATQPERPMAPSHHACSHQAATMAARNSEMFAAVTVVTPATRVGVP